MSHYKEIEAAALAVSGRLEADCVASWVTAYLVPELRRRGLSVQCICPKQDGETPKNAQEIAEAWLKDNGYSGLVTEGCGCVIGDLFPCDGGLAVNCCPGYAGKSGTVYVTKTEAKADK